MQRMYLLGPQRPAVNLDRAFRDLDTSRPVAVISAGWQEAEGDIDHVQAIVKGELKDLKLYHRAEALFLAEPGLRELYRSRQDRLQELQRMHRIRLKAAMLAARQLLRSEGNPRILRHEQRHAIAQLRTLDRHHMMSIAAIHKDFDQRLRHAPPAPLVQQQQAVAEALADIDVVVITGGNVAVLLNRLRLFGLDELLANKTIVAWSAGAMALTNLVVLFHDRTPLGYRDAEILEVGLGFLPGVVVLPDATHRLRLKDRVRVGLFSRRFAPSKCLTLDNGAVLESRDGKIVAVEGVRRLLRSGAIRKASIR